MKQSVLIVEDEQDVADLVRYNLGRAGFQVQVAADGASGLEMVKMERPDCMVLDLMLPGMSGVEVCRRIRRSPEISSLPVIMLTARGEPEDRVKGLQSGADDYVTKPFSPKELVLRVQAVLRRSQPQILNDHLTAGRLTMNRRTFEVRIDGTRVELTTIEFKLLCVLVERRNRVQSRESLLQDVWGYSIEVDTRTVDTHVRRLREKLGELAIHLETIRGEGYIFRAET